MKLIQNINKNNKTAQRIEVMASENSVLQLEEYSSFKNIFLMYFKL